MNENQPYLSVVVPLYNEEGNVTELHKRIHQAVQKIGWPFEIISIDDGFCETSAKGFGTSDNLGIWIGH